MRGSVPSWRNTSMRPASTLRTSFLMLRGDVKGRPCTTASRDDVGGERLAEAGGDQALLGRVGRLRAVGQQRVRAGAARRARGARDREPGRRVERERRRPRLGLLLAARAPRPSASSSRTGSGSARARAAGAGSGSGLGLRGRRLDHGLGRRDGVRHRRRLGRRAADRLLVGLRAVEPGRRPPERFAGSKKSSSNATRPRRAAARAGGPSATVAEKKSSCGLASRAAAASASANGVACSNNA